MKVFHYQFPNHFPWVQSLLSIFLFLVFGLEKRDQQKRSIGKTWPSREFTFWCPFWRFLIFILAKFSLRFSRFCFYYKSILLFGQILSLLFFKTIHACEGNPLVFRFVPDGYIPRLESKKRECWKFLDWRLNSENDSRLHGQPFFSPILTAFPHGTSMSAHHYFLSFSSPRLPILFPFPFRNYHRYGPAVTDLWFWLFSWPLHPTSQGLVS